MTGATGRVYEGQVELYVSYSTPCMILTMDIGPWNGNVYCRSCSIVVLWWSWDKVAGMDKIDIVSGLH